MGLQFELKMADSNNLRISSQTHTQSSGTKSSKQPFNIDDHLNDSAGVRNMLMGDSKKQKENSFEEMLDNKGNDFGEDRLPSFTDDNFKD